MFTIRTFNDELHLALTEGELNEVVDVLAAESKVEWKVEEGSAFGVDALEIDLAP